ncbi:MAG: hypothetical protein CUN56_06785 [Phototrophicales bacterium]|nr:MAG: hypothetical protein CUN56_06785 [Phototrophicales bacterium]
MKPGLERATTAAILGFIGSVVFTILLRGAQNLQPVFDPEVAMILGAFVSSFAFTWGMGATNPQMSQHPHEPEYDPETGLIVAEAPHEEEEVDEVAVESSSPPFRVLGYSMWQISFWVTCLVVAVLGFATLPTGLYLQTAGDPEAQTAAIGMNYATLKLPFGGAEIQLSQLAVFVGFIIFTLVSLMAIGGGIALVFTILNRVVKEVENEGKTVRFSYETNTPRETFLPELVKMLLVIAAFWGFWSIERDINPELWRLIIAIVFGSFAGFILHRMRRQAASTIQLMRVVFLGVTFFTLFSVLYILHYEVLVGLPIARPGWLRTLLSHLGTIGLTPLVTFLLFPGLIYNLIKDYAGKIVQTWGEPTSESTDIQPVEVSE